LLDLKGRRVSGLRFLVLRFRLAIVELLNKTTTINPNPETETLSPEA